MGTRDFHAGPLTLPPLCCSPAPLIHTVAKLQRLPEQGRVFVAEAELFYKVSSIDLSGNLKIYCTYIQCVLLQSCRKIMSDGAAV